MKRHRNSTILIAFFLCLFSLSASAANRGTDSPKDTDTRMIDTKVVEVADNDISVLARSGVEHVIAINRGGTRVIADGAIVSLADLREGDVVTIELDAENPMKFAKNIQVANAGGAQVAKIRR